MKNLLLLPILFLPLAQAEAHKDLSPRILEACTANKWIRASIYADVYTGQKHFCILPDGNSYLIFDLYNNENSKYTPLFRQYSGKSPTPEQVEKAKDELKKQGDIVN